MADSEEESEMEVMKHMVDLAILERRMNWRIKHCSTMTWRQLMKTKEKEQESMARTTETTSMDAEENVPASSKKEPPRWEGWVRYDLPAPEPRLHPAVKNRIAKHAAKNGCSRRTWFQYKTHQEWLQQDSEMKERGKEMANAWEGAYQ